MSKPSNLIWIAVLIVCSYSLNLKQDYSFWQIKDCLNDDACCLNMRNRQPCQLAKCFYEGLKCKGGGCKGDDACCRKQSTKWDCENQSRCRWNGQICFGEPLPVQQECARYV